LRAGEADGPDGEHSRAGLQLNRGFEAGYRDGSDRPQPASVRAGEHLPASELGCAVPARVDGDTAVAHRADRDGRTRDRVSVPGEPVGAIRVGVLRKGAVEDDAAGGVELRKPRVLSPADEDVALLEQLHVSLAP